MVAAGRSLRGQKFALVAAGFSLRWFFPHMKEKPHRLSKELYVGRVSTAFTLCVKDRLPIFRDTAVIETCTRILIDVVHDTGCIAPVFCFMPDHQHVLLTGTHDGSDLLDTIGKYKQKSGYWLSRNRPGAHWQKDFYDHIIRKDEVLSMQIRYILDNPVRQGLVESWNEYPFKGAIGCDLDHVLNSTM